MQNITEKQRELVARLRAIDPELAVRWDGGGVQNRIPKRKENSMQTKSQILILSSLFVIVGCSGMVTIPSSDSSPPTIKLALIANDVVEVNQQTGPAEWEGDTPFSFLATATDANGGVKSVEITVKADVGCSSGHSNQDNLMPISKRSVQGAAGDEVSTSLIVNRDFTTKSLAEFLHQWYQINVPGSLNCDPFTFVGHVKASAENFHAGTAITPEIEILVQTTLADVQAAITGQ